MVIKKLFLISEFAENKLIFQVFFLLQCFLKTFATTYLPMNVNGWQKPNKNKLKRNINTNNLGTVDYFQNFLCLIDKIACGFEFILHINKS